MADLITPTTKLEAVNAMLEAIGEAPVSTLQNPGLADAAVALQTLKNVSRRAQTVGWSWNTDERWPFTPDVNGNVFVPANTLRADSAGPSACMDVVLRGNQLYDRGNHTYTFTVGKVFLNVVQALDFEQLPEAVRQYVYLSAGCDFVEGVLGAETLSTFTRTAEKKAWALLLSSEGEDAGYNILTGSYAVARVLDR